jgi:hypothetical protein
MEGFWISWYHHPDDGPFELHRPWWVSGFTMEEPQRDTIVAAVQAESVEAAWEVIHQAYDTPPTRIETRFCEPLDNRPVFSDRFPRADWMKWPV